MKTKKELVSEKKNRRGELVYEITEGFAFTLKNGLTFRKNKYGKYDPYDKRTKAAKAVDNEIDRLRKKHHFETCNCHCFAKNEKNCNIEFSYYVWEMAK